MKRVKYTSASEVGRAKFCERAFAFKELGHLPSGRAIQRMKDGTQYHEQRNEVIMANQGVRGNILVRFISWLLGLLKALFGKG